MGRISNLWVLAGLVLLAVSFCDLHVSADVIPSENECRPYIEKAIHELKNADTTVTDDKDSNESTAGDDGSIEGSAAPETGSEDDGVDSKEEKADGDSTEETGSENKSNETQENQIEETASVEGGEDDGNSNESAPEAATDDDNDSQENPSEDGNSGSLEGDETPEAGNEDDGVDSKEENDGDSAEEPGNEDKSDENSTQETQNEETASGEEGSDDGNSNEAAPGAADEETQENQLEETASVKGDQDDNNSNESAQETAGDDDNDSKEDGSDAAKSVEEGEPKDADSKEDSNEQADADSKENDTTENQADDDNSQENASEDGNHSKENESAAADDDNDSKQTEENQESGEAAEGAEASDGSNEQSDEQADAGSLENATAENTDDDGDSKQEDGDEKQDDADSNEGDSKENDGNSKENSDDSKENTAENDDEASEGKVRSKRSIPDEAQSNEGDSAQADDGEDSLEKAAADDGDSQENTVEDTDVDSKENAATDDDNSQENTVEDTEGDSKENAADTQEGSGDSQEDAASDETAEDEETDEDDLTIEFEIPKNLRPHGHVNELLGLNTESTIKESSEAILKELKKVFDNAIKPLETTYKYRDLSNRHFGDPEIFSKPLVLFMGPYSGGKSTILNYLTENEYTPNSIRSGAEPSPAYFNILMHGDKPEVLDGTQLAADWTFSGLQKFGQALMDRLRGQKLPNKLLERVNIVEIPGILEVRKQVSRHFPFNDACQWFIDRADIIFLVYDPSKLDVGPETEAILDQLKGREYQTRILLNKADQVKPEELLRVQGALIWNISPLMASAQPPVMYTVSLWSHPFESGAPVRLLQAQERAFLADLREAIDKRIENKIASARRFAVRIRNHAKMVDCYLTTYYNQKGLFSNKKQVSDKIIENPQTFNIYEGLSTLTNISRYDLPDPEVYLDFFRLNPLYEFRKLSETCTYFKGCPINKLDIAIAYELPELARKYKTLH